ncbi:MAG: pirin family protein [Candidatus Methylomirabilis oxyfera]|nr:pirin family protein [Candidatus Methylomirabilis oxyfera]
MITRRPSHERGHANHGWLDTYHTFSFAGYHNPLHMGFRHLRVINEDRVQPGSGFDTHSHHDMEIITYVLEGSLEHRDSMGNQSIIVPGDVQRMSAGTGVAHSEYNPSHTEPVHLLQIWILPERKGLSPSYQQRAFQPEEKRGSLRVVASRDGRDGSVTVHQDVELFAALLEPGEQATHRLLPDRHAWLQVAGGAAALNGIPLRSGDGAAVSGEDRLEIAASERSEVLLFDLA